MATVTDFIGRHQVIGLDTPVFIYQYEAAPDYLSATETLFTSVSGGLVEAVTSVITLAEVTVKPLSEGRLDLVDLYYAIFLRFPNLRMSDIDIGTAQRAAQLRAKHRLRIADTLQIAACLEAGATGFVTNDRQLQAVNELEVFVLADSDDVLHRS